MSGKENDAFLYGSYLQDFCYNHFNNHRQELSRQLQEIEITHEIFQQTARPEKHPSIRKINDWESDSILFVNKIYVTASTSKCTSYIQTKESIIVLFVYNIY
jgi:hypothetical protein